MKLRIAKLLLLLSFFLTANAGSDIYSGSSTPKPDEIQKIERIIVRPSPDVLGIAGGGLGFWSWLWQTITIWLEAPTEIDFLCDSLGQVVSTAPQSERNDAVNALVQARFQGLGGNGRPYAAQIFVIYADGGSEAFTFIGTSSSLSPVAGTLMEGTGQPEACPGK